MRSLLLLLAIAGVAHADRFPATGPCDDIAACEKACKANKKGTCYWGGVLVLQTAAEDREARAGALFGRACKKGDGEACWQAARLFEASEEGQVMRKVLGAEVDLVKVPLHALFPFSLPDFTGNETNELGERAQRVLNEAAARL